MRYLRWTSNYIKIRVLFSFESYDEYSDPIATDVKTSRIDNGCSLEKESTKLIGINPSIVLYIIINQVHSCHKFVHSPST